MSQENGKTAATQVSKMPVFEQWECRTRGKFVNLSYTWYFHDFEHRLKEFEVGDSILSAPFFSKLQPNIKWNLKFRPRGHVEEGKAKEDKKCISISLQLQPGHAKPVFASYDISCLHQIDKKKVMACSKFNDESPCWGYTNILTNDALFDKASGYLRDGVLTFRCTVEYLVDVVDQLSQIPNFVFLEGPPSFSSMFDNDFLSDFTISSQEKPFRVHKNVLANRSPVFHAIFRDDLGKNQVNEELINDYKPEVVHETLRYMYTNTVENMKEHAKDLLGMAEKYQLQGLKKQCEEFVSS